MPGAHPIELWISLVLRIGVLLSAAIILIGLSLFLLQGQSAALTAARPTSWQALLERAGSGHPLAIIQVGLLVLILTPIARVGMTVILFAVQREWHFVLITTLVLVILVFGLLGIGA